MSLDPEVDHSPRLPSRMLQAAGDAAPAPQVFTLGVHAALGAGVISDQQGAGARLVVVKGV